MRDLYFEQLDAIVDDLVAMTTSVRDAVHEATDALLTANQTAAEAVISGDREIDASREVIEEHALQLLATQQPVATDLRMLVASLRMVADLERMGDLAVHIAKVARMRLPDQAVPESMRSTISQMADVAVRMVDSTSRIVAERCDLLARIPIGAAESLNASVAAGIALHEAARRRGAPVPGSGRLG